MSGLDLKGIFETVRENKIIMNLNPLQPEYVPEKIFARDREIHALAKALTPATTMREQVKIFVCGSAGTGKTLVVKALIREMQRAGNATPVYINCGIRTTSYRVLAGVLSDLGKNVPFTGWPTDKLYKKLGEFKNKRLIIFLDEVDRLNEDNILHQLSRMRGISTVMITNDGRFKETLPPETLSSLLGDSISFKPYNADDLTLILEQRAVKSFNEGAYELAIPLCAALAARDRGDAKRAITVLKEAARIAEIKGVDEITREHVAEATARLEEESVIGIVQSLPPSQKAVLYAAVLLGDTHTGELYRTYMKHAGEFGFRGVSRLTMRRVSDLIEILAMHGLLTTHVLSKGRYGRTRIIKLAYEPSTLIAALAIDPEQAHLWNAFTKAMKASAKV